LRATAVGVILVTLLAGCGAKGERFETTLSTADGEFPLLVELGDGTDLVTGIEALDSDVWTGVLPMVEVDPTDRQSLIFRWLGGMCDNNAVLAFQALESGYSLHLGVARKLGLGCPAAGVLRTVRIRTSIPIDANSISLSGSG
jgi:hypothetical protein